MQVKGSILQYFQPLLSYHLSLRSVFCLFLIGGLRPVLLYMCNKFEHDSKTSEYDQELPKSQITDQSMAPRGKYKDNTNKTICAFSKDQGSNLALYYLQNAIEFY